MDKQPYSIYIDHRPFRIAFLVDENSDLSQIDRIIKFNREKWGGRFNPIILIDGKTIEESWWNFLKDYDPDIIHSMVKLSDELKKKIHVFLSPLHVEEDKLAQDFIRIDEYPISIPLTKKSVRQVAQDFFNDRSNLVIFEVNKSTPEIIKKFIDRNFGLLNHLTTISASSKRIIEECNAKVYTVTDDMSLNSALLDLGDTHNRVVFPAQICSLPNSYQDAEFNTDNEKFAIIVGNSIHELIYFWNRTLTMGNWMRTRFTQLWLPTEFSNNETLRPGLEKFINWYVEITGNDNSRGAHFISFSLSDEEIKAIGNSFSKKIWKPISSVHLRQHLMPHYRNHSSYFFLKQELDFHRAHSDEEYLVLNEPDVEQSSMGGEQWFVDIYIQFRPERFMNIQGKDYWWQLPRRNSILQGQHFFNKPSRINRSGMFSVLMSRRTSIRPENNTLIIKLPSDGSIFYSLICGESYDLYEKDTGSRSLSRSFGDIRNSDKGMYLSGVLSLFPDLFNAHYWFEERFWRDVFERMSNCNSSKDERVGIEIFNKLKRKITSGMDIKSSDEAISWLAHNVLNIAKQYSKEEVDFHYKILYELAQKETAAYNSNPSGSAIEFNERDFKERITDLIELGVFVVGIKPKCPRCGYKIWYQIDETKQRNVCKGCGYEFSLSTEQVWYYRLNSLIKAAVSQHGTVPVLLVLGQLMNDSRSSFMFMPSSEVFKNFNDGSENHSPYGEIDIICIKDGELVIGEIKQTIGLFDLDDFRKMLELAKLIRPDIVIFSSMDEKPNKLVEENIKELQTKLSDLEIKVEWYPIHRWAFEPRPVG